MVRLHPDDIAAIAAKVAALLSGQAPAPLPRPALSIAQQAINLARQGLHQESKDLLKSHSKRRAA